MTGKGVNSRRRTPILEMLGNRGQDLDLTPSRYGLVDAGDDLVLILMELTLDVDRFDSMLALQRELLLQGGAHESAFGDDQLDVQWQRLSSEATELVACARQALERLRRLSEDTSQAPPG